MFLLLISHLLDDRPGTTVLVRQAVEMAVEMVANLLFGLGDNDTIDQIEVRWPSGIVQTVKGSPDRTITITETR